ncbi:ATP-binding protein [Sphingomonas adhaesiva]|uniref:ATP-binding protein n=1 Tax=Sphingomonas adhaesiva TaxID=28212 RepID=UPI002FF5A4FA
MIRPDRRAALPLKAPSLRWFLLAALAVPALLAALIAWLGSDWDRAEAVRVGAVASAERRAVRMALLARLTDAETAQRGYLLTGDAAFLRLYEPARIATRRHLARHPDDRVVAPLVAAKFAELDRTIALFRRGDADGARRVVARGEGRRVMAALRTVLGRMIAADERRYEAQRLAYARYRERLRMVLWLGSAMLVAVLGAFLAAVWRLRRQRHAALVEAFEAAERNATVLDSTIDALLILNPSGTVESMNAAATRMLGHSSAELERRDIATIIDLAPGQGSFHQRIGLVDGQLRRAFFPDRTIRHRDGREVMVDVAIGVMHLPSGVHLVVSLRDISERKRIERVKDELMSTVSHELRTPLTSVVGSLGLLRAGAAGEVPSGPARLIEIAENNSRRLIRLINDMLDIDRIESGRLEIARAPVDLRDVLARACEGSEGLARAAGVSLDCVQPPDPVMVEGDGDRLLQVVTNLLSNAIRAAPRESSVGLTLVVEEGRASIAIDDRGAGIPAAFRDRIFGRFERATPEDGATGTGLGLAISREIVVRHGGSIWFEDRVGGGTRFVVALPLPVCADRDHPGCVTVLVCEADEQAARDLIAIVVGEGCGYDLARTAGEARAAIARHGYSALLVGWSFTEEGGAAFAQALRRDTPRVDVPVVVVPPEDGERRGPGLDMIDWIDMPSDTGRLTQALRAALARRSSRSPIVLHLDDDRDLLAVVAAALEPEARVMIATDLAAARAILQRVSPDVAILDMKLAAGAGPDLIPLLVDADGAAIPTIIYSAQDVSAEVAQRVDAVVVKARDAIPDLKATIRRLLHARDGGAA